MSDRKTFDSYNTRSSIAALYNNAEDSNNSFLAANVAGAGQPAGQPLGVIPGSCAYTLMHHSTTSTGSNLHQGQTSGTWIGRCSVCNGRCEGEWQRTWQENSSSIATNYVDQIHGKCTSCGRTFDR